MKIIIEGSGDEIALLVDVMLRKRQEVTAEQAAPEEQAHLDKPAIMKRLRELRGTRSRREVGEAIGVTGQAIAMYENGLRIPEDNIKIRMANYYNVSVQDLFYSEDAGTDTAETA